MAKILLTGMSAPQTSAGANIKALSFAGVLNQVLVGMGHEVTWADPQLHFNAESARHFDSVIVGLSPITSLGANRTYGALATINALCGSDKLFLFVDAPTLSQIEITLRSVANNPENLTKDFFSYRKGFAEVKTDAALRNSILSGIDALLTQKWPTTLFPALPWSDTSAVEKNLPGGAEGRTVGVNLDSFLVLEEPAVSETRADKWVYDVPSPHWTRKVLKTVTLPGSQMKYNKGTDDNEVQNQIARSVGALISSDRKQGTWWSYRYIQALNAQTPIATEWKESSRLGQPWATLPATIEELPQESRDLLSLAQRDLYLANIPGKMRAVELLNDTLKLI